jgi:hypothetical protein
MNVRIDSISRKFATRENGAHARQAILLALSKAEGAVTLDFEGIEPTPSFADEFVGRLAEELGSNEFRARVRFINLEESTRLLLQTVITKRLRNSGRSFEPA